jgi:hypothetical protein
MKNVSLPSRPPYVRVSCCHALIESGLTYLQGAADDLRSRSCVCHPETHDKVNPVVKHLVLSLQTLSVKLPPTPLISAVERRVTSSAGG